MKYLLLSLVMLSVAGPATLQGQQLKVLTYNIHHGENMKGRLDLQGIANVILATNADLVALQEVDSATRRTGGSNQLKELASLTGMYTCFVKAMDFDGGAYGVGVLSRLPITACTRLPLPGNPGAEPRVAGIVSIRFPGDSLLQFVCTHLDAEDNPAQRIRQADTLLRQLHPFKAPILLAGDFNATPESKEITTLKTVFTDATQALGPSFPADSPTVKLDYIMLHPAHRWNVNAARIVEETVASDHRPVLCELELKQENR